MGPPSIHRSDAFLRRKIEALGGYGFTAEEIATVTALDPDTVRLRYRTELLSGEIKANAKVAENLFRKATGEGREAVVAAIFWLKARARWREMTSHEVSGKQGAPIRIEISVTDAYRREYPA